MSNRKKLTDEVMEDIMSSIADTTGEVYTEAVRQIEKWGEQNHFSFAHGPIPTSTLTWPDLEARSYYYGVISEAQAKEACEKAFKEHYGTYAHIFIEEVCEAIGAEDGEPLIEELIQVAAVCVNWILAIKRRQYATIDSTNAG